MSINKETKIFGSFSKKPGGLGNIIHNAAFQYHNYNAIYKSFAISNLDNAIIAMKELNFSGMGISAPYKVEVLKYADIVSPEAQFIGAANTLVQYDDKTLGAYNTDWLAVRELLSSIDNWERLCILGDGGYARAIRYAARDLGKDYKFITRKNWENISILRNDLVFNATPVTGLQELIHDSNLFIDCHVGTFAGTELTLLQASHQFNIYTGLEFPIEYIRSLPEIKELS